MNESTAAPGVDDFRLLVVDDECEIQKHVREIFESDTDLQVISAMDQQSGLDAIERYCLDAAVVDVELKPIPAGGYEVLRQLAISSPDTPVVVYTHHVDPEHVRELLDLIKDTPPNIIAIVDKTPLGGKNYDPKGLRHPISGLLKSWRARKVALENRELALELLARREDRIPRYRAEHSEVEAELDRICRTLFGDVSGLAAGSDIGIRLNPLGAEGLSAAMTVEAEVILGDDASGQPVTGSRCVLKIGPVDHIREEVDNYDQFVKYGVRLRQRVELLGHTYEHALGAVCYSFAGGVFGSELVSLDEVLDPGANSALASEAIKALFDRSSQSWYAVQCDRQSGVGYVVDKYKTDFGACYKRLDESLGNLQKRLREPRFQNALKGFIDYSAAAEEADGSFEVGGQKLTIPRKNLLGTGKFVASLPSCLVHGDMHGGNVMLELEDSPAGKTLRRVCLIDYRSAGPGPRPTDAVALQASLRLIDAKQIIGEVSGGAGRLSDEQLANAVRIAASREAVENEIIALLSPGEHSSPVSDAQHWQLLDAEILNAALNSFDGLTLTEYVATSLPLALRYFGFRLGPVARVRMLSWVSAQMKALDQATTEQIIISG